MPRRIWQLIIERERLLGRGFDQSSFFSFPLLDPILSVVKEALQLASGTRARAREE
jgi:hypothetical protein